MNHTTKIHDAGGLTRWPSVLIVVFVLTTLLAAAAICVAQNNSSNNAYSVYDDFNEKWIDPARWLTGAPGCWGLSLECVRQIRDGQLYLAARNIGWNGQNSDTQWSQSDLYFVDPNSITRITAAVTVRQAHGTDCALNPDKNGAQVFIGGAFFNTGINAAADLVALVIANHHDSVVDYGIWWGVYGGPSQWVHITTIPMGTPVTMSIDWDQPNHQFVATLILPKGVIFVQNSTYPFSDTAPPSNRYKTLTAATYAPNCIAQPTSSYVEASFDNVIINK